MEEKSNDMEKIDDVMLPGFRFHPTDEELVGFYLKRKIQQRLLPIELIKQVDIYKYDPWDLPKLASTGEKECYFYCPRDRKYRNSARPNRVTGAGFWKATGTDRPIYSSEGSKCIGLKKSLVFYRGRAAKGIKTDWMMHEFRLPTLTDSPPPKQLLDKSLPANDSWAICRIFKKTNSMAQRALSHSWASQLQQEPTASGLLFNHAGNCTHFTSENMSCTTDINSAIQFWTNNDLQQQQQNSSNTSNFSAFDNLIPYKPINNPTISSKPAVYEGDQTFPSGYMFSPAEKPGPISPSLLGTIEFDGSQQQPFAGDFSVNLQQDHDQMHGNMDTENEGGLIRKGGQWGSMRSIGFPFSLGSDDEAWKPNLASDNSPNCPSDMSTSYSTNKCYT